MAQPTPVQQARRDAGPLTPRGSKRKQQLLVAARAVFEEKGFIDTRVHDIATRARVSHGTFYTYFDTKEAIFKAVAFESMEVMLQAMHSDTPSAELEDRVADSIRRYIAAYRPAARMIALMEAVGTFSPEMRQLRLDARDLFVRRTERGIARMVEAGIADRDLDVRYTSEVLGSMAEYTCYVWFTLEQDFDEERVVRALSDAWHKALLPLPERS
jgi:AcrR family transcriptional regulator